MNDKSIDISKDLQRQGIAPENVEIRFKRKENEKTGQWHIVHKHKDNNDSTEPNK